MSDYISREAVNEACREAVRRYPSSFYNGIEAARDAICHLPAADVRSVVRGMWTKELHPNVRYNQYKCSVCGKFSGHDEEGWIWKPNFCPNCGAAMGGT